MKISMTILLPLVLALLVPLAGCGGGDELASGMARMERGDYGTAVRHFQRAAQRTHGATAYANLGIAYWKLGATDLAIDALAMASDLNGDDPRPLLLEAEVLLEAERWEDARHVLNRLREGMSEQAVILTYQARLEYKAGRTEQAIQLLEEALAIDPQYPPALYNMAVLARDDRGEPMTAMRFFSRYLSVATDQPRIDHVHGELARLRQPLRPAVVSPPPLSSAEPPTAAAVDAQSRAPVIPPTAPATDAPAAARLLAQAQAAVASGAQDEALVLLGQARALDPDNADVVWTLAAVYDVHLGQPSKADTVLREFESRWPTDPRATSARRRLAMLAAPSPTPPSPATQAPLTEATMATPTTTVPPPPPTTTRPPPRRAMGDIWPRAVEAHAAGRREEALALYREAATLDPTFAAAAYNIGILQKELGQREAAQASFAQATSLDPRMAKAHYMLALTARESGERDTALAAAKQVLVINPRDDKANYLLGLIYREALRYDQARDHFQRALDLAPDETAADKANEGLRSVSPGPRRR